MYSAVVVALSYLIDPDTPKNDGTFRPITVVAKQGTVVWANPGMPVTLATNHCGQEIIEAIVKALAPACPDRAMAGWGRRFRIAIQGRDPRADVPGGKPFIWHFFQARPGGGASPAGDGWPGAGEWQAAGGIKFGSLEVTEVRFPLFFRRHEFRPDSGGVGKYRGGPGGIVEMVVETAEPAIANTAGDGVRHGACGILGGADGLPHRYTLYSEGEPPRPIKTKETGLEIRPGDVLILESGGGGGWGNPADRDPAAIAERSRKRLRDASNTGLVQVSIRSRHPLWFVIATRKLASRGSAVRPAGIAPVARGAPRNDSVPIRSKSSVTIRLITSH